MPIDRRGRLQDEPFSYRESRDALFLCFEGRTVRTLRGADAEALLAKLRGASGRELQLLLAKATGNFKRGNER
ncbi:MAG: hypothetical protein U0527_03270 [Candidatus Eisenbacteria bacterium]